MFFFSKVCCSRCENGIVEKKSPDLMEVHPSDSFWKLEMQINAKLKYYGFRVENQWRIQDFSDESANFKGRGANLSWSVYTGRHRHRHRHRWKMGSLIICRTVQTGWQTPTQMQISCKPILSVSVSVYVSASVNTPLFWSFFLRKVHEIENNWTERASFALDPVENNLYI